MRKVFTLSTCDTSRRILKLLDLTDFEVKDIKTNKIAADELDEMQVLAGSYEALFSRRSRSYGALGLKDKGLSENNYREYILSDYTFLKRPVIIDGDQIFIGNQKKNVAALNQHFGL
jgi:arsenate reductase-like glutaredoxin family protein